VGISDYTPNITFLLNFVVLPVDNLYYSFYTFLVPCVYMFCKREICHCHYAISGCHSNEFSNVNKFHERKLSGKSRKGEQSFFFSIFRVPSVSIDDILM
jgi:hypothetical protein